MKPVLANGFRRSKELRFEVQIDSETGLYITLQIWQCRIRQSIEAYARKTVTVFRHKWSLTGSPLRMTSLGIMPVETERILVKGLSSLDIKLPCGWRKAR